MVLTVKSSKSGFCIFLVYNLNSVCPFSHFLFRFYELTTISGDSGIEVVITLYFLLICSQQNIPLIKTMMKYSTSVKEIVTVRTVT